jgi:prolyl-tRNA editing enzyme YbaK/EbsC (Cys-tRNA(Pro) deacylase)
VAQIAKSIIFRAGDEVVLVIASGAHRIDRQKVAAIVGTPVKSADPAWVLERTGFAGGWRHWAMPVRSPRSSMRTSCR